MKFDFDQIESENVDRLCKRIVGIMAKTSEPSKIVLSNLSEMLCYIYLHFAKTLGTPLQFLQQNLSSVQNPNYMLQVLSLLPEKIDSSELVIEEDLRKEAMQILVAEQQNTLMQLNDEKNLWNNEAIKKKILFECFNNWINFTYDPDIYSALHQHNLFLAAVKSMGVKDLSEQAC